MNAFIHSFIGIIIMKGHSLRKSMPTLEGCTRSIIKCSASFSPRIIPVFTSLHAYLSLMCIVAPYASKEMADQFSFCTLETCFHLTAAAAA